MKTARQTAAILAALIMFSAMPRAGAAEPPAEEAGTVQSGDSAQASGTLSPDGVEEGGGAQTAGEGEESAPEDGGWKLMLTNPWNPLPEDFTVELSRLSNGLQVDQRILADLNAMLEDCRQAGLRPLVCSAYRSYATQKRLHNNKIARLRACGWSWSDAPREAARWVAVPGTSEHQTGLAVDIVAASYQVLNRRQERTAEQKWLMEHCWEYGFILRYPSEKCDVTGIGYEPWHYRYVGREDALAIRDSGLCLEEYIEALRLEAEAVPAEIAAPEGQLPEEPSGGALEETAMDTAHYALGPLE